jgi:hypothetical protein
LAGRKPNAEVYHDLTPEAAGARAFSSEVDTGSREENAIKQRSRAFSSEVDTGSREENAIKQRSRDVFRCHGIGKCSSRDCANHRHDTSKHDTSKTANQKRRLWRPPRSFGSRPRAIGRKELFSPVWPGARRLQLNWLNTRPRAAGSDRRLDKRRKAKSDHLVERRFRILLIFHDEARMAEPYASGVDEARRKCGISRRKLA